MEMYLRKKEAEFLRKRVAKIIIENDNTLTSKQIRERLPRVFEKTIYEVAKELGLKLPQRELLTSTEMDPHRMTVEESRNMVRMKTWPRDGYYQEDSTDWDEVWREIE